MHIDYEHDRCDLCQKVYIVPGSISHGEDVESGQFVGQDICFDCLRDKSIDNCEGCAGLFNKDELDGEFYCKTCNPPPPNRIDYLQSGDQVECIRTLSPAFYIGDVLAVTEVKPCTGTKWKFMFKTSTPCKCDHKLNTICSSCNNRWWFANEDFGSSNQEKPSPLTPEEIAKAVPLPSIDEVAIRFLGKTL